ncbi:MAG TPA: ester cyclase [Vicinamibacterales bacterium]|nr:ester cyclase [Vicinamibacterales bacterium]
MNRAEVETWLARHRAAFDARDADRLAAGHSEHGTFESPAAGKVSGRAAIRQVYAYWLTAFPDLEFTWDRPVIDGDRVAFFWRFRDTAQGAFFGDVKAGTRLEFSGAGQYRISSEGIEEARHVFDFTGALINAGVLKVKPL